MNYQEELKKKMITAEDAVLKIQNGDYVHTYGISVEPNAFLKNMHLLKGKRENVTLINFLSMTPFDFYTDESYRGVINNENMFFSRFCTAGQKNGTMSYIPNHLRNSGSDRFQYMDSRKKGIAVYVISVSPMDKHGYFTTSTFAMSNRELVERSELVILEINENLPRTFGDTYIHISEADCIIQGNNEVKYLPSAPIDETDMKIGNYISELVEDGSTIQLGIGGIPNAVASALKGKKDLGVHTEMIGDGIAELYKEGVITNRRKTHYKDRMVTTFSFGGKETYDFLDNNVGVLHLNVAKINAPDEIAKNNKMVSVNSTLQIDLMGQCASEAIGTLQLSGIGGQADTIMGAKMSPGGKSIMALHSTAFVKDSKGQEQRISKIVSIHPAGTVLSLLRADIDYVVTEYGIASLRGASLRERAESLIQIAHPDFRDGLKEEGQRSCLL